MHMKTFVYTELNIRNSNIEYETYKLQAHNIDINSILRTNVEDSFIAKLMFNFVKIVAGQHCDTIHEYIPSTFKVSETSDTSVVYDDIFTYIQQILNFHIDSDAFSKKIKLLSQLFFNSKNYDFLKWYYENSLKSVNPIKEKEPTKLSKLMTILGVNITPHSSVCGKINSRPAICDTLTAVAAVGAGRDYTKDGQSDSNKNIRYNMEVIAPFLDFREYVKKHRKYKMANDINNTGAMGPNTFYIHSNAVPQKILTNIDGEKETENTLRQGDILLTGPLGEQYVLPPAKFLALYNVNEQVATPRPLAKLAARLTKLAIRKAPLDMKKRNAADSISFKAPWGEDMIANVGDFIIKDTEGGYYRVQRQAFRSTYKKKIKT